MIIYIASCTENGGIYKFELDSSGMLNKRDYIKLDRPMYMAKSNNILYVLLREPFKENSESGLIKIYDGEHMQAESEIFPTKGEVACHLCIADGSVYAVNYISGNLIKLPDTVVTHAGHSVNPNRQSEPHTHFIGVTPDKKYICCTDLGTDKIYFYDFDLNYKFDISVPAGSGARHLEFSEDGNMLYCANELSNTVSVFEYSGNNTRFLKDYSTLPSGYTDESTVAAIRRNGKYLYVSNRGHDSIACFEITGKELNLIGIFHTGGSSPRDFNVFGNFLICANENSDNVTVFEIRDGKLMKLLYDVSLEKPLCII